MFDCTTNRYAELYSRWLDKPDTLLRLASFSPDESLLDLCGGSGIVSEAALEELHKWAEPLGERFHYKGDVTLYDLNPRVNSIRLNYDRMKGIFKVVRGKAEKVDLQFPNRTFDVVVIRQAIGYIDVRGTFEALSKIMEPGGRLVFNSFVDPLAGGVKRYSTKQYKHEGERFFEAHLALFNRVFHIQAKLSGKPGVDVTAFKYHDETTIMAALLPYFTWEQSTSGRSVRWRCVRKPYGTVKQYMDLFHAREAYLKSVGPLGLEDETIGELNRGMVLAWNSSTREQQDRIVALCEGDDA